MICVPIVGPDMAQALRDIASAAECADVIELRLDLIAGADARVLLRAAPKPCIVTNRAAYEGGQFKGSEESRLAALRLAMDAGADFVDIEAATPAPLLAPLLAARGKSRVILSHHNFSHTPDDLGAQYQRMAQSGADILKIVTFARDITDNVVLFNLLRRAARDGNKLIALCMGELGEVSRILSPLLGGFLTFGALSQGKESAPGQIPADVLKRVYRVNEARPDAKIYGLIGNPVSKSMGYLIHNRAFRETGLPHIYVPFLVADAPRFFAAFSPFFSGLSVTMPHKESIMPLLGRLDAAARKIGAVNTVVREGDVWAGYNTDCSGALKALAPLGDWRGKNALILGSGGTAKAIGHGLAGQGARVTVTYHHNRERGEKLARELNGVAAAASSLDGATADLLINCSPVGMSPDIESTPWPAQQLRPGMTVFDSVYNPPETRLLREAKAAGCATVSGVELFLRQAAEQFELWTGQAAPLAAMRETLAARLGGG